MSQSNSGSESGEPVDCLRQELRKFGKLLQSLHARVSLRPLSVFSDDYDRPALIDIIASCSALRVASVIANTIINYLFTKNTKLKGLRATTVFWFVENEPSWPVIEWIESDGTMALAIFHFELESDPEEGSWLMHSAIGDQKSQSCNWKSCRMDWNVLEISHLKILLGVAQHLFGMLQWPNEDLETLYCERGLNVWEEEQ